MLPDAEAVRAYTINDFCSAYGIGRTLAYRQIATGMLKACKVGNRTLILRDDAQAWAQSLPSSPSSRASNG